MAHDITLIPGASTDDTPLTAGVLRTVAATGVDVSWHRVALDGHVVTAEVLAAIRKHRRALIPYINVAQGQVPPIVALRRELGVFGNIRPLESVPGLAERHPDVDLVVVRETTEDIYANLEHESIAGVYESFKVTTKTACERIARHAFEFAKAHGRKKVTIVHKANIMKQSDGLFLRTCQRVGEDYPDIEVEDFIVDALCMKLVLTPSRFDVLVCANLFGDIVSDLCAGLVGGFANCPSINVAEGASVFTVGHGDPANVARTDSATPISLLFSCVLLLRDLGENDAADRLMGAVTKTLAAGTRPVRLGGEASTTAFCDAVIAAL